MFSFSDLKHIQIEITNRCQASCPMCLRNIHGGIENPLLIPNDWTVDQFRNVFNAEVLGQIQNLDFCGDFGDPIINNGFIDMCRHVSDNAPNVNVIIHTNGSARTAEWWSDLAKVLPASHKVNFALDGLSDTHNIYRIGTNFDKIIENATAFIRAGGNASWVFIKFKHNQHQESQAEQMATELGFNEFVVKKSKRFSGQFPVLDKSGNIDYYIEQFDNSNIQPVTFIDLKDYKDWTSADKLNCFTFNTKEAYIDAHGHILPCCLIASFLYANYDIELHKSYGLIDNNSITPVAKQAQDQVYELINELGGLNNLDVNQYGIKEIMNRPLWQELLHNKWKEKSSIPCVILCSNSSPYISITDQIIN